MIMINYLKVINKTIIYAIITINMLGGNFNEIRFNNRRIKRTSNKK